MTDETLFIALIAGSLAVVFVVLWVRRGRNRAASGIVASKDEDWILVDGSNVMHWQDNVPSIAPLERVVWQLQSFGYVPGIVFDANAGWKLQGRYLRDSQLAFRLGLETRQVLVVPKGTQADPYLLATAKARGARIVTNDRFRDWADQHPEVLEPGLLIRGGVRDGQVWLTGLEANFSARKGAL
jgi:Zc3h12a-like Ribonuclease NYN domain